LTDFFDSSVIAQILRVQSFNGNLGSGQNVLSALNYVRTQQFSTSFDRRDVPNIIVLVTDSASSANTLLTVASARAAQQDGTKIFAIGSSSRINVTELQLVASAPRLQFHQWWTINDFSTNSLNAIKTNVENELCRPEYEMYCRPTEFGGYQCFCPWGSCDTRPLNGSQCIDVNECAINNGGCQQLCSNRVGSYACSCLSGFLLASDGMFCDDINECLDPTTCATGQCVNSYGTYYCVQPQYYISSGLTADNSSLDSQSGRPIIYSSTSLVISVTTAVVISVLVLIIAALSLRYFVNRHQQKKLKNPPTTAVNPVAPRAASLSSWGFDSVRSAASVAVNGDDSVDVTSPNEESHSST
jgi:hypothetical protein